MSCGISTVKCILFLFNLLTSICGVLLLVFGAILFSNVHNMSELSEAIRTQQLPVTLMVLGAVIIIISFFGCCGALRDSYCMCMTYAVFLFVLMIGQLALVTYMWLQKDKYLMTMGDVVERAWQRRTHKADYMDGLQIAMECCGRHSYTDYTYQGYFPPSCCKDSHCRIETVYRKGCKAAFVEFWDTNSDVIKFAGLLIAAVEFVAFVFACCVANSIRNFRRRSAY